MGDLQVWRDPDQDGETDAGELFSFGDLGIASSDLNVTGHSAVCYHFNMDRHLHSRPNFKLNRTTALAEWRQPAI